MKKLLLGLIAIFAFNVSGNAQSNTKNPFDYVGSIHNQIIKEYLKVHTGNQSTQEICGLIQTIANKNPEYLKLKENAIDFHLIETSSNDFKNKFQNVINGVDASEIAKTEMQILVDYMFTVGFSTQKTTYTDFYNHIVAFENKILANKNLSDKDKKTILSGSSTARFSGFLWIEKVPQNEVTAKRGWFAWAIIGAADVVGTLAGGGVNVGTGAAASGTAYTLTAPDKK